MAIVNQWAGHFLGGGSDKVWAAAYTDTGEFHVRYGKRGTPTSKDEKAFASKAEAATYFENKVNEKIGKGYKNIPFDNYVYGAKSFEKILNLPLDTPSSLSSYMVPLSAPALIKEQIKNLLGDLSVGAQEAVAGEVVRINYANRVFNIYTQNQTGIKAYPQVLNDLKVLGDSFLIEASFNKEECVLSDLLEYEGKDLRTWPYVTRITWLEALLRKHKLINTAGAQLKSLNGNLKLLKCIIGLSAKEKLLEELVANNAHGVVFREITAERKQLMGDERLEKFQLINKEWQSSVVEEPSVAL